MQSRELETPMWNENGWSMDTLWAFSCVFTLTGKGHLCAQDDQCDMASWPPLEGSGLCFLLSLSGCRCSSNLVAEPLSQKFSVLLSGTHILVYSSLVFQLPSSKINNHSCLPFLLRTCSPGVWLFLRFGVGMHTVGYWVWLLPVLSPDWCSGRKELKIYPLTSICTQTNKHMHT